MSLKKLRKVSRDAKKRCVEVRWANDEMCGHGSGVILKTGLILTVFHNLEAGEPIFVDKKKARVVKTAHEEDLVLLTAKTRRMPRALLGKPKELDLVLCVSNPLEAEKVVLTGIIAKEDKSLILSDIHATKGSSGAGLWNIRGELVGVVEGNTPKDEGCQKLTTARTSRAIRELLGNKW